MKTIIVKARMNNLEIVTEMVEAFLAFPECSDKTKYQVGVSVEEVFTNIASYAVYLNSIEACIIDEA